MVNKFKPLIHYPNMDSLIANCLFSGIIINKGSYKYMKMKNIFLYFVLLNLSFLNLYSQNENILSEEVLSDSNYECITDLSNDSVDILDTVDNKLFFFTIRLGQGGFNDNRSPINKLGGGQLALDIKYNQYPIAISISTEYYTNSSHPTHTYEISDIKSINILYMSKFYNNNLNIFAGGGIGLLEVPKSEENPDLKIKTISYNFEIGLNYEVIWNFGLYGIGKYLYACKNIDGVNIIDFSEKIVLLGITYNFSI